MQREIKFRGWDVEEKIMRNWDWFNPDDLGFLLMGDDDMYIPMQYTGLKDKNGKDIYEKDIIKVYDENDEMFWDDGMNKKNLICDCGIADVEFFEGMWYLNGQVNNSLFDLKSNGFKFERIGNIYENPDLLTPPTEKKG